VAQEIAHGVQRDPVLDEIGSKVMAQVVYFPCSPMNVFGCVIFLLPSAAEVLMVAAEWSYGIDNLLISFDS
jgi:hypothetical protein